MDGACGRELVGQVFARPISFRWWYWSEQAHVELFGRAGRAGNLANISFQLDCHLNLNFVQLLKRRRPLRETNSALRLPSSVFRRWRRRRRRRRHLPAPASSPDNSRPLKRRAGEKKIDGCQLISSASLPPSAAAFIRSFDRLVKLLTCHPDTGDTFQTSGSPATSQFPNRMTFTLADSLAARVCRPSGEEQRRYDNITI